VAPILDRGSPIMANGVLAVVRRMLNYGIRNDWLDANPASLIDKPGQKVSRERVLTDDGDLSIVALTLPSADDGRTGGTRAQAIKRHA
jgi:hypothetical protein